MACTDETVAGLAERAKHAAERLPTERVRIEGEVEGPVRREGQRTTAFWMSDGPARLLVRAFAGAAEPGAAEPVGPGDWVAVYGRVRARPAADGHELLVVAEAVRRSARY